MKTILITGGNRGIGLAMTKLSLEAGHQVLAGCRRPDKADMLQQLGQQFGHLSVFQIDVASDDSVAAAYTAVSGLATTIDLLINNAGVNPRDNFATFSAETMVETLNINAVGAMRVGHVFASLISKNGGKIVNVSSQLGSLHKARPNWGGVSYNTSKAAMNMVSRQLSFDFAADGVAVIAIHPGWVQTDMGGMDAAVTPHDSAAGILRVAHGLTMKDSGEFFVYSGEKHPW